MKDLEQRFRVFIEKLTERAESLAEETRDAIQEIYDEDADPYKRSFGNFLMGVKGQFKGIIDKAEEVFKQQIKPHAPSFLKTQTLEGELQEQWFRKIHDDFEKWKDKMRDLAESIENQVKKPSAEEKLREIVEEYNAAKDFAEEKTREEEKLYEKISSSDAASAEEEFLAYFLWRAAVWKIVADTVPTFAEANKKVFYREMDDLLFDDEFDFDEKPDLYRKIIAKLSQMDGFYLQLAVGLLENLGARGIPSDEFGKYLSEMKDKCN